MTRLSVNGNSTMVELIAGIATDARDLAAAHTAQIKAEVNAQVSRAKSAAVLLAIGAFVGAIGITFLAIALVNVLVEQAGWSAWAAWLAVGGGATVIGGTLLAGGSVQLKEVRPIPTRSLQSIRESFRWMSNN